MNRQSVRTPTQLAARVKFADSSIFSGIVTDLSETGLFVRLPQGCKSKLLVSALVGSAVNVALLLEPGEPAPPLEVKGHVARVASDGVGVRVPRLSASTLRELHEAGAARAVAGTTLESADVTALQHECSSLLGDFLEEILREFFARGAEDLSYAGDDERTFMERSRYRSLADALTQQRARIKEDFFESIRERVRRIDPGNEDEKEFLLDSEALRLIDDTEFEDSLSLDMTIKEIGGALEPDLGQFEERYSRLVGRNIARKDNPFGPVVIGRSLQAAIQRLDSTNSLRAVLYSTLGQVISKHGPTLYQRLNNVLASLDAPSHAPGPAKPAIAPGSDAQAEAPHQAGAKHDLNDLAEILQRLYADAHGGTPGAKADTDDLFGQRLMPPEQPLDGQVELPEEPSGQPTSGTSVDLLRVVDRLQETRRNLAGGVSLARGVSPGSDVPAGNMPDLGRVLAALDHIPLDDLSGGDRSGLALSEHVEASVTALEGVASELAQAHRKILDATSQLFERARADIVSESEVEELIKRLERPLLKLALRDQNFPANSDHPARQVLNFIERFSVAADEKGKLFDPKLRRFLHLVVDRLDARAEQDPGIYDLARKNLWKVLKPILKIRRQRVALLQEGSEASYRVRKGRARVNEALAERLGDREVPSVLLRLLDAGWRQYMVLLETRDGTDSAEWHAALNLIAQMYEYLAVPGSESDSVQDFLSAVEEGISTVNVDADLRSAFMSEIKNELEDRAFHAPMVFVPRSSLVSPQPSKADDHRDLIDGLRIGEWWAFNRDSTWIPMQLVWLSESRLRCTFADRSATRKLDLPSDDLARRIREGVVKPEIDRDLPLLDRTEFALLDDSYRSLLHQTQHDSLTGLLNRKGFMQRMHNLSPTTDEGCSNLVGILEFDQFRLIRNSCGEQAGESLVREIVSRVWHLAGPNATVAALREDTLAFVLADCSDSDGVTLGAALLDQLKNFSFKHQEQSYRIGFNLGLSEFVPAHFTAEEALRRADTACINAKSMGRNQLMVYEQETADMQDLEYLTDLAGRLDHYLGGNGLFLRCQKVMPLAESSSKPPYFEVLLGVYDRDGKLVSPLELVSAVERLDRMLELDLWVIANVFEWIGANRPVFDTLGGFAINLSASSLRSPELYERLNSLLAEADFPTAKIIFEITESTAIERYGVVQDFMRGLRQYGSRFCLDDFGTGFTSYAHLKNLSADTLKIDGSFVKDMLASEADFAMVRSMNDLAHSLGLATVAEYVESAELVEALKVIGVDYGQGYAIHKPCHIDELALAVADDVAGADSTIFGAG